MEDFLRIINGCGLFELVPSTLGICLLITQDLLKFYSVSLSLFNLESIKTCVILLGSLVSRVSNPRIYFLGSSKLDDFHNKYIF